MFLHISSLYLLLFILHIPHTYYLFYTHDFPFLLSTHKHTWRSLYRIRMRCTLKSSMHEQVLLFLSLSFFHMFHFIIFYALHHFFGNGKATSRWAKLKDFLAGKCFVSPYLFPFFVDISFSFPFFSIPFFLLFLLPFFFPFVALFYSHWQVQLYFFSWLHSRASRVRSAKISTFFHYTPPTHHAPPQVHA
jgi:hypothetical protein